MIATLPTGADGADELWKLNHYYERLDDWNAAHGIPRTRSPARRPKPLFELHNLTADPEERTNRTDDARRQPCGRLQSILDDEREAEAAAAGAPEPLTGQVSSYLNDTDSLAR